jgi:hypothetical protein
MFKTLSLSLVMVLPVCSHSAFGQIRATGQEQIFQSIIINGRQERGVIVVENGTVQTNTCPSPQAYVTVDRSSSGWACLDPTTGMWFLGALPPGTTYTYQQPQTYAPTSAGPVYSYPYSDYYSYGFYPYYGYYPFVVAPRFGIGFGFRSPIIINRPVVISRGGPVVAFSSRPFGGFRQAGRIGFGRIGRR